jgi:hypothetical protein
LVRTGHRRLHQQRHQRNKRAHVDHLNAKIFVESGLGKQPNQLCDVADEVDKLPAGLNLQQSSQNRE